MSKHSKKYDLWAHALQGFSTQPDFCPGCGYHRLVHGEHRKDCTLSLKRRTGALS